MQIARKILNQPALDDFNGGELSPGLPVSSDDQILAWVARDAETALHPSCTCRLGTDELSVVDPATMRVHGLKGIRVVDASVMPYVTNGNIYAPVMMIAEKAADMILGNTPACSRACRVLQARAHRARKEGRPMGEPRDGVYIGGRWVPGAGGEMATVSPSSGETFGTLTVADRAQAAPGSRGGGGGRPVWAAASAFERAEVCASLAAAVLQPAGRVSPGRSPRTRASRSSAEAYDEVDELALYLSTAGEEARRLEGSMPPVRLGLTTCPHDAPPPRGRRCGVPVELALHDGR